MTEPHIPSQNGLLPPPVLPRPGRPPHRSRAVRVGADTLGDDVFLVCTAAAVRFRRDKNGLYRADRYFRSLATPALLSPHESHAATAAVMVGQLSTRSRRLRAERAGRRPRIAWHACRWAFVPVETRFFRADSGIRPTFCDSRCQRPSPTFSGHGALPRTSTRAVTVAVRSVAKKAFFAPIRLFSARP